MDRERPRSLQQDLDDMDIVPATASTVEYYQNHKDESYPINLKNEYRGRVLLITMTKDREGWKEDVKSLHDLFHSLPSKFCIHPIYDVDAQKIHDELKGFAEREDNTDVDMLFVFFMGHGYDLNQQTYFRTTTTDIEIYSTCSQIFKHSQHLQGKPKLFILQLCRKEGGSADDQAPDASCDTVSKPPDPAEERGVTLLNHIHDYIMLFACHPDQYAYRGRAGDQLGSRYVQGLSNQIKMEAHNTDVQRIQKRVNRAMQQRRKTAKRAQMSQELNSVLYDVNIFPGISKETDPSPNPGPGTKCQTQEEGSKYHHGPKNTDVPDFELLFKVEVDGDSQSEQADAEDKLRKHLETPEGKQKIECHLSKELDTDIHVAKIEPGSVKIYITLRSVECVEKIHHLSTTGYWSLSFQHLLVTEDFLHSCGASGVRLHVTLDEESYQRLLQQAKDINILVPSLVRRLVDKETFLGEEVTIYCPVNSPDVQWYKSGQKLTHDVRIGIGIDFTSTRSLLTIKNVTEEDQGVYTCQSQKDLYQLNTECYLYVYNFGCPSAVECEVYSSTSVLVQWKQAVGKIDGYQIIYYNEEEPKSVHVRPTDTGNETKFLVENLVPGGSYNFRVTSVSDSIESDDVPRNGQAVLMPYGHFDVLEDNLELLQKEMDLSRVLPAIRKQRLLSPNDLDVIDSKSTHLDKVTELVKVMKSSPKQNYRTFKKVLSNEGQKNIIKDLESAEFKMISRQGKAGFDTRSECTTTTEDSGFKSASTELSELTDVEEEQLCDKVERMTIRHSPELQSPSVLPPSRFLPDCHLMVFEGGRGEEDTVIIKPYQGEKHSQHDTRDTYIAVLDSNEAVLDSNESPRRKKEDHDAFVAHFTNLMPRLLMSHNIEKHGKLRIMARFGKLYYFDRPPKGKMTLTVGELLKYEVKNKGQNGEERQIRFRSSLMPMKVNHDILKAHLHEEGYKEVTEEERILIQVNKIIQVHQTDLISKEHCFVVQDGGFNFLELWNSGTKWIELNVIRQDSSRRDVRVNVESELDTSETDPSMLRYKNAYIITKDASNAIVVKEEYRQDVNFVREKVTTKYSKTFSEDFKVEVHLIRAKEYSRLDKATGRFGAVKDWREELVIQPEIADINKDAVLEEFAKSLIELCYKIEKIC